MPESLLTLLEPLKQKASEGQLAALAFIRHKSTYIDICHKARVQVHGEQARGP